MILENLVNKLDPQINPIYSQSLSLILINNIIESGGTGLGKITVILDLVQVYIILYYLGWFMQIFEYDKSKCRTKYTSYDTQSYI